MKTKIKGIFKIIKNPTMRILPGQLAFFIILSFIPLITITGAVFSLFGYSISNFNSLINSALPTEVSSIIIGVTSGTGFDFSVGLLLLMSFILASNSVYSIILTSNFLYNITSSNSIKNRIKAFILTFFLIFLVVFIVIVLGFGRTILINLSNLEVLKNIKDIILIFDFIKYPMAFILIFFVVKLIYMIAPDKRLPSKLVDEATLFTTVLWLVSTFIFSLYVEKYANYDIFYGPLSNLVILMLWIYILSYIFVIGISINVNNYQNKKETK